jgi:hypothetical protein
MRIEFDAVPMPHRKLLLRVSAIGFPRKRIPGPYLEWVEQIQLSRKFARCQFPEPAYKISIDIVGVVLVFGKGSIRVNVADTDLPELLGEHFEIVDQPHAPRAVPRSLIRTPGGAICQDRSAKFLEGDFVVSRRQKAVWLKGWNHLCSHFPPQIDTLDILDTNVKVKYSRFSMGSYLVSTGP